MFKGDKMYHKKKKKLKPIKPKKMGYMGGSQ